MQKAPVTLLEDISKGFIAPPDDLSKLRLVNARAVRDLADSINQIDARDVQDRKLVVTLGTGGTLAMTTKDGIRIPHLDFKNLFGLSDPHLQECFEIRGLQMFNVDSSQMDYRHTREMAIVMTYLWRNIKGSFMGFLITHGTDTMSYTAAAVSLMMGQGLPFSIVFTGAQRPIEDPISDAPNNIRSALYTLEALYAQDMAEVLIVMGDRAVLATSAEKVDDTRATAFDAPRHRYVSTFQALSYPVKLAGWLNPRRKVKFEPTIWQGDYSHTLVLKSSLGLDPHMALQQVELPEVQAVILYSYGAGTFYEPVIDAILPAAHRRNMPVFVVNSVHSDYRIEYLSSFKAVQMGATPLDMTLSSALAKIEIALRMFKDDVEGVARFMAENYVGEIPTPLSRFS
jgi:L-asparaginase